MPKNECDPEDPFELVGVELPGATEDELRDMALCFAEEFAREGWNEEQLIGMFKNPHLVWKQKGDEFIRQVIQEAMKMWRPQGGRHA